MKRRTLLQLPFSVMAATQQENGWGGAVIDTHLHLRKNPEDCWAHMKGCGVTHAVLLTRAAEQESARVLARSHSGRFVWSVSANPSTPEGPESIRKAIQGGAVSVGELKFNIALDSPEMRRVYDICAETGVPVMMHIQTFPHYPGELPYNTGYKEFDKILRAYPKTNFIGHGDLFWAHISATVPTDRGYPDGPVKRGGWTDRLLSDYPNLYGDVSANSGNNGLSRDPEFTRDFLVRHRRKLVFGSDCACSDGKGSGVSQGNNPEAKRLMGKCVARETLGLLKQAASPEIFRQITWENPSRLFRVTAAGLTAG